MITTIHQPEHLPWLGFIDKMRQADLFVLLDNTQYAKRDVQNRNRIKTANGPIWLTVPVYQKKRYTQRILDVEICYDKDWRKSHWSQMERSYKKAPYFDEHGPFFEKLYATEWTKLVDLNTAVIRYLVEAFGIDTKVVAASEIGVEHIGASEVLHAICEAVDASVYISGKMGRDYLDESAFNASNIDVVYQDFHHPEYTQLWGEFEPYMSSLDLLFNHGADGLKIIEEANERVLA